MKAKKQILLNSHCKSSPSFFSFFFFFLHCFPDVQDAQNKNYMLEVKKQTNNSHAANIFQQQSQCYHVLKAFKVADTSGI